jgi:hypothetical protein
MPAGHLPVAPIEEIIAGRIGQLESSGRRRSECDSTMKRAAGPLRAATHRV